MPFDFFSDAKGSIDYAVNKHGRDAILFYLSLACTFPNLFVDLKPYMMEYQIDENEKLPTIIDIRLDEWLRKPLTNMTPYFFNECVLRDVLLRDGYDREYMQLYIAHGIVAPTSADELVMLNAVQFALNFEINFAEIQRLASIPGTIYGVSYASFFIIYSLAHNYKVAELKDALDLPIDITPEFWIDHANVLCVDLYSLSAKQGSFPFMNQRAKVELLTFVVQCDSAILDNEGEELNDDVFLLDNDIAILSSKFGDVIEMFRDDE